jgi:hypothetical protein
MGTKLAANEANRLGIFFPSSFNKNLIVSPYTKFSDTIRICMYVLNKIPLVISYISDKLVSKDTAHVVPKPLIMDHPSHFPMSSRGKNGSAKGRKAARGTLN